MMMRWAVAAWGLLIVGFWAGPSFAETSQSVSLHVLQDTGSQPAPSAEPVRWVVDASQFDEAKSWPPALSAPEIPEDGPIAADLARAKAMPRSEALVELEHLSRHVEGTAAYHLWWQIAERRDRPEQRLEALRLALRSIAKSKPTPEAAQSRRRTEMALLTTFAWQGEHDAVLRLAAEVLAGPATEAAQQAALEQARRALLLGASAKTRPVPMRWVVQLARELEHSASGGRVTKALEVLHRHGNAAERERSGRLLAARRTTDIDEPWARLVITDPNVALKAQVTSLLNDCRHVVGRYTQGLELDIRHSGKYPPVVQVTPNSAEHATCISERGPEYLQSTAALARVQVLPAGANPFALKMQTKALVVASEHTSLDEATTAAQQTAAQLKLPLKNDGPRGAKPAGIYVTVERSDAYSGLDPARFWVVVAHGPQRSPELRRFFRGAKRSGVEARIQNVQVCVGCAS